MSFTTKQLMPGETVVALRHQHALVLLKPALWNVMIAIVLTGLVVGADLPWWVLLIQLIPLVIFGWEWLDWRSREYIVTSRRVVRQEGIANVRSADTPLDKVNNVLHEQGIVGRLFGYGKVALESASEQGITIFDFVPDPVGFKNCIVRQRESWRGADHERYTPREDVPALLEQLASLRDRGIINADEYDAKKKVLLGRI